MVFFFKNLSRKKYIFSDAMIIKTELVSDKGMTKGLKFFGT